MQTLKYGDHVCCERYEEHFHGAKVISVGRDNVRLSHPDFSFRDHFFAPHEVIDPSECRPCADCTDPRD